MGMDNIMASDEIGNIQIHLDKQKRGIQISILAAIVFFGSVLLLYSDRHNDARYLMIDSYAKDRQDDLRFHAQEVQDFQRQLAEHTDTLKEIKTDVKSILNEVPHSRTLIEEDINRHSPLKKDADNPQ
jgi:hypothetical protein